MTEEELQTLADRAKEEYEEEKAKVSPNDGGEVYANSFSAGITRRDWLAGLAMRELASSLKEDEVWVFSEIAEFSYKLADAMIAESNK